MERGDDGTLPYANPAGSVPYSVIPQKRWTGMKETKQRDDIHPPALEGIEKCPLRRLSRKGQMQGARNPEE